MSKDGLSVKPGMGNQEMEWGMRKPEIVKAGTLKPGIVKGGSCKTQNCKSRNL